MTDGIRKRDKATDVLRNTDYVFAKKCTFAEAFPSIATLRVDVERSDYGRSRHPDIYTEHSAGEMVDCRHPLCYGGGFSLGNLLRMMMAEKKTDQEFFEVCRGYHGSPKGRRNYGSCGETFRVIVHIDYRPEGE
jgi:hypothetical protein